MDYEIYEIEAEDLLREKLTSLGLCELVDILTANCKEMNELELAVFEAAMDSEKVKALLIQKACKVYKSEILERLYFYQQ